MIGKLNVWRGEHRKDAANDKMRVGGLVSIEELNGSREKKPSPSPAKPAKKKSPKLTLGRRSLALTKSHSRDNPPNSGSLPTSPPLHTEAIFSNFPATETLTPGRRPSAASEDGPLSPPSRPRTAEPIQRRRSKTAPNGNVTTFQPWADKPLPLAIDIEGKTRHGSRPSEDSIYDAQIGIATAIVRPRTASGPEMPTLQPRSKSDTSPIKPSPVRKYSLTPSITPNPEFANSRRGSKATIAKTPSNASVTSGYRRQRRGSEASSLAGTRDSPVKPVPIRSSILDEVEGTLSATITELQELQGGWHINVPLMSTPPEMAYAAPQVEQQAVTPTVTPTGFPTRSSSRKYRPPTNNYFPPMPHSAREPTTDDYYYETSGVGSQSLPPTPLNNASFQTDLSSLDPRLQSIEKLYEEQKRQMHALSHEKDHVQRQLAFFRTKLSEFDAEKASHLRATKDTEESLQITLMKLREAKVSESAAQNEFQSARNEISILEARCEEEKRLKTALAAELVEERTRSKGLEAKLEEVNVQKIDLLERELEMRMEIVVTKKKYKKSAGELIDLKRKQSKAQLAEEDAETKLKEALSRNQVLEEHLKQLSPESDLPSVVAQMAFKLEDLQRQLKDKDELVGNLKTQNTEATQAAAQSVSTLKAENDQLTANVQTLQAGVVNVARSSPSPTSELKVLQQKAANLEASLNTARNEREQYANLLHAEVRRTAVEQHERTHPALPLLKKKLDLEEAVELVRSRAAAFLKPSQQAESEERHDTPINAEQDRSFDTDADATEKIQTLQKEIDYYLNDIVLYKLDVKGYKKDLRKARERIRELSDGAGLSGKGSVGSGSSSGARTERLSGGGTEDVLSDGGNRV